VEIPLTSAQRRAGLLLVAAVTATTLISQACLLWIVNRRLESGDLGRMERGAHLLPGDGEAWDRLGRLRQWDFVHSNLPGAIEDYQRAVKVDPRSAYYWMDLAGGYEASGDQVRAQEAYSKAEAMYPASAEVAFYYGNFLLREGKFPEAYRTLQRAVGADSTLLPLAVSRSWRANGDVNQILNQLLPANADAYLQAVDFFASIRELEPALAVWQRLVDLGQPFPLRRAFPLLDQLIHQDLADDAHRVWLQALTAAALPHAEPADHSLVWNGNFATDFVNGGLDWRWNDRAGAAIGFDSDPPPRGARGLRVDFGNGSNLAVDGPFQYVPVEPGSLYHFHGYMRTQEITTESGMRFAIDDPHHPDAASLVTENFTGSHPWTAVEGDLATGAQTHFLAIRLLRVPSRLFDNKLGGTVWIADISLVRASADVPRP
jgi:hypothetical protein